MDLEAQSKDEERQREEITEELKRFMLQEMARGFPLFEEALLVCEAQDLNVAWCMKVVATVENVIQCYHVICGKRKKSYYPDNTRSLFPRS